MEPRLSVRVGVTWAGRDLASLWPVVDELEAGGWDSLWLPDLAPIGGIAPLPVLAAVAGRTARLKLGTNALVLSAGNPVTAARELAAVDALSGGRLLPTAALGLQRARERQAMGVPREERAARLEEAVAVVRALWTGEPVTHEGRFWSFSDLRLSPRPARPRLELWLGARTDVGLRRVGRIADGWLASADGPDRVRAGIATIRTAAAEAGRTIDEDHYGATIHAVREPDGISPGHGRLLELQKDVAPEDHVGHGLDGVRRLLERFLAVGATKFVLVPHARDVPTWLRELREVVDPLEAAGAPVPSSSGAA
ncbi:LLM class flavin-dependent oxidoreductase [Patulibacter minatonensis]|uniref:LLM class flavin-dependent oxidoreductase n=1 Tax=Patulibacter minatonensis TaxID=298163 RepID=UPI000686A016|nr:LLM class flavin-dependent oxidoreductase [Patulibacter minatonensis]